MGATTCPRGPDACSTLSSGRSKRRVDIAGQSVFSWSFGVDNDMTGEASLVLVDGHLRADLDPEVELPVLVVDLTPEC